MPQLNSWDITLDFKPHDPPRLRHPWFPVRSLKLKGINNLSEVESLIQDFFWEQNKLHSLDIQFSRDARIQPSDGWTGPLAPFPDLSVFDIAFPQNVTGLTEFTLIYSLLIHPPDTLLAFLEKNPWLEHVKLVIQWKWEDLEPGGPTKTKWRRNPARMEQLQSLSVVGNQEKDLKALIPCISIPEGAKLVICSTLEG